MIVGGGNIGAGLARQLEKRYSVKLIERNQKRAEQLSEHWNTPSSSAAMRRIRSCWRRSTSTRSTSSSR
jgi:predicted dinucleotide-binding enzyme